MDVTSSLTMALGLVLFSLIITAVLIVPFIDLLYKLKITRRKEAPTKGKVPLFDKLHDKKAGTPTGGGILLVAVITGLFFIIFPIANHMGVYIKSPYNLSTELFIIYFTFISFGILGLFDDLVKIFGKKKQGPLGMWLGLSGRLKLGLQAIIALIIAYVMYNNLGIQLVHIPMVNVDLSLGWLYVPFAAFVIISFTNAFNITDGLDGLSSGLLVICLMAFGAISASILIADTPLTLFIALSIGALLAFLYFNIYPARVWLGDAGAMAFGSMLAVIGLLTGGLVALVVIGGIFVIEVISSAIQIFGWRLLNRPIFPIAPLHHTLEARGWEEPKIVMRAWLLGIVLAIVGLWLATI